MQRCDQSIRVRTQQQPFRDQVLLFVQDHEAASSACLLVLPHGAALAARAAIARRALAPPRVAQPILANAVAERIVMDPDVRVLQLQRKAAVATL